MWIEIYIYIYDSACIYKCTPMCVCVCLDVCVCAICAYINCTAPLNDTSWLTDCALLIRIPIIGGDPACFHFSVAFFQDLSHYKILLFARTKENRHNTVLLYRVRYVFFDIFPFARPRSSLIIARKSLKLHSNLPLARGVNKRFAC